MHSLKRLLPFAAIFFLIQTVLRITLLGRAIADVGVSPLEIIHVFAFGLWFDLVVSVFVMLPIMLYILLLPASWQGGRFDRIFEKGLRYVFCFILLFEMVSEHLFWTEFTTRLNFIAVDYLIYTQEVIGNIQESYPVGWMVLAIVVATCLIVRASYRFFPLAVARHGVVARLQGAVALVAACVVFYTLANSEQGGLRDNAEASEVADSGIYNLFYAAINNEISYERFYAHEADDVVYARAKALLSHAGGRFVAADDKSLARHISAKGNELHKNVILVVMESMSADYMGIYGNQAGLTPNLDRLAKEGLFFSNLYATGTRTVRGLEATTLSIPPTPGQSIVRRPDNGGLFSLGYIFADRGYDTSFIYGGYGYFDNMNQFFSGNGFRVIDRNAMTAAEIGFANVWGICDEDMFSRAIAEGDAAFAKGQPFMQLIMTTSNHRPYTYPEGRIDIPSHANRLGGVKYADYAVGKLIADARKKPWFKDTVFIFVADHTAGAGGKAELDPHKYHIPMIFYAPEFIKPQKIERLASQIDMAPVLLGLLKFDYVSKFYGVDILTHKDAPERSFISNFQKVALVEKGKITVLSPKRAVEQFSWPNMDVLPTISNDERLDTIGYYQSASWWRDNFRRVATKTTH